MITSPVTKKVLVYVGGVSTLLTALFGVWKVDDRYAKAHDIDKAKDEIILTTRREIVKNRSAMIATMEREYDDLGYDIIVMQADNIDVPRYIEEKRRQLKRDIATLRDE